MRNTLPKENLDIVNKRNKTKQISKKTQLASLSSVSGTYLENVIISLLLSNYFLYSELLAQKTFLNVYKDLLGSFQMKCTSEIPKKHF